MPLARLRAALPAAALSLLLLTGCTAADDGVTPASTEGDVVTVESISDGDTLRVTLGEVSTREV